MDDRLRSRESLLNKYSYEVYDPVYPNLYSKEEKRLSESIPFTHHIYHIGSTSIPNVGGKGVIDILITSNIQDIKAISSILLSAGYEFRASGGEATRLFHQREYEGRRYHVHLSPFNTDSAIKAVAFRDYLRQDAILAREYLEVKKKASNMALQLQDKDEMKRTYALVKEPVIKKILASLAGYIKLNKERYINI